MLHYKSTCANIMCVNCSALNISVCSSKMTQAQGNAVLSNLISDVEQVQGKSFDYIVVGGGTTGCPLAATLSENFTVLLVERGGSPFEDPLLMEKNNFYHSMSQANEFTSTVQKLVSVEGVTNYRGRVLGGSSAINGGVYSRTSEEHIQSIGWDGKLVKEAYEWVESRMVFEPKELTPLQSYAKDIFVHAGMTPFNGYTLEHVEGTKTIGTSFDENQKRHCSAHLLQAGNASNLTVLLNATVKNIIFSRRNGYKPQATGIRFIKSNGDADVYEAYLSQPRSTSEAAGDVVLSAGAIGSPHILMLSGIGPEEHLNKFNIRPLINAPHVGQDIIDNPGILFLLDVVTVPNSQAEVSQVVGVTKTGKFLIQFGGGCSSKTTETRILQAKLSYPRSRGKLELSSTDPRQNPCVKFNYLLEEGDLDDCVEMVHKLKKVAGSIDSVLGTKYSEKIDEIISDQKQEDDVVTEKISSEEELRQFCKRYKTSYLHSHGGCNVGAVVDKDYRVSAVEGLRVVDASTLNDLMGTSPMGTLLMLGRYQGIKMLRERDIE